MLSRMLRHEWRALTSDATLWILIGIFALSISYGTLNGARWAAFQRDAIVQAQNEERERFSAQEAQIARIEGGELKLSPFADPRNPGTAGGRLGARYAALPPSPLAPLAIGQSDLLPSYFKMTTDAKQNVTAATELENPHRLLAGRFDLAFVLIYLYPLLILAISYNLLSAEKEQGTLALLLSQPVSVSTLALAKVTLRFLVFLGAIVGLAGVALTVAGLPVADGGVGLSLLLWLSAIVAYGLFWFALAIAVAALGRPSATNAMTLAAIWLLLVALLPSMCNLLATTLYPVPSRVEMVQAVRLASDEANQQGSKLLSRYYEDHPELAEGGAERAMNDFNIIRVAVGDEVEMRVRPVLETFERQLTSQQQVIDRLRFLSPAILMQDALNDIAGTGVARHRHFMQQVSSYHAAWRSHFVPLVLRKAQLTTYDDIPRFVYVEESLGNAARRVSVALVGLLFPACVLAAVGFLGLRRYSVVM